MEKKLESNPGPPLPEVTALTTRAWLLGLDIRLPKLPSFELSTFEPNAGRHGTDSMERGDVKKIRPESAIGSFS